MTTDTKTPFDPSKFKRELVTVPLSKWVPEETKYLKLTSHMYKGKEIEAAKGKKKMEPADLINCIDLASGKECVIIVNTVLGNILRDELDYDYLDQSFEITQHDEGKDYKLYSVALLETDVPKQPKPTPDAVPDDKATK